MGVLGVSSLMVFYGFLSVLASSLGVFNSNLLDRCSGWYGYSGSVPCACAGRKAFAVWANSFLLVVPFPLPLISMLLSDMKCMNLRCVLVLFADGRLS